MPGFLYVGLFNIYDVSEFLYTITDELKVDFLKLINNNARIV